MQSIDTTGVIMEVRGKGVRLPILFEKLEDAFKQEDFLLRKKKLRLTLIFGTM